MKCLIVCFVDNGGQGIALYNALNKYTEHDVRCITFNQSYLNYEMDIFAKDYQTPKQQLELRRMLEDREFFIFSELIPWKEMDMLGLKMKIGHHNSIIRVGGSAVRKRVAKYFMMWLREGYMLTGGAHDWSLIGQIGLIAPTRNICPVDKMPEPTPVKDGEVRIAFAPTKFQKGVVEFNRVMKQVKNKYPNVKPVRIMSKEWLEALRRKATCNVTFDRIPEATYGNSVIESMWLGHAIISNTDLWTDVCYPDLPILKITTEEELYDCIVELAENPEMIKEWGTKSKEYVQRYHHPEIVAKQWDALIKLVASGKRLKFFMY